MDNQKKLQSDEYNFPYHYLPKYSKRPKLTQHWPFAPSYLAALGLVREWLRKWQANHDGKTWKHIDIGCGDGALLFHLSEEFRESATVELFGIDYDVRALQWARQFNEYATILSDNISELKPNTYDSASLVEVAEHIPPDDLTCFLDHTANTLREGGRLIITVPSTEKPLQEKHYQHFSFDTLQEYVGKRFYVEMMCGFEKHTLTSKLLHIMLYRSALRIEMPFSSQVMVRTLGQLHSDQDKCGRIFAILRKL